MMVDYIPGIVDERAPQTEHTPKQSKGGTFATTDMELLKRSLMYYKDMLVQSEDSERNASEELIKVANLLHRIGRIA